MLAKLSWGGGPKTFNILRQDPAKVINKIPFNKLFEILNFFNSGCSFGYSKLSYRIN